MKKYVIKYQLVDCDKTYETVIESEQVEVAQLVWDSMVFLRNCYKLPLTPRPK